MLRRCLSLGATAAILALGASLEAGTRTGFIYQGQLKNGGVPANGTFDFLFSLWDSETDGRSVVGSVQQDSVEVDNGLFQAILDFGDGAFNGDPRWLEIAVRPTGDTERHEVLAPRQPMAPTPYALSIPGVSSTASGVEVTGDVQATGTVAASAFASNSPLIFKVNPGNVECARFDDTNCFLGIGTATPQARLHVSGTAGVDGIMFPDGTVQTSAANGGGSGFWAANGDDIYKTNSGNVGVGTTSPAANVEVRSFSSPRLRVAHVVGELGTGGTGILELKSNRVLSGLTGFPHGAVRFLDDADTVIGSVEYSGLGFTPGMHFKTNGTTRMFILPGGNVGIGASSLAATLAGTLEVTNGGGQTAIHASTSWIGVHGIHDSTSGSFPGVFGETNSNSSNASGVRGYVSSVTPGANSAGVWGRNFGSAVFGAGVRGTHDGAGAGVSGESANGYGGVFTGTASGKGLLVFGESHLGKVGIGTTSIPTGVVLAVDGKMLCEEVEVQLSQDWPDYVFEDSYDLMPIAELENQIRIRKHLPGMPPAHVVKAEGLAVGAMQARLLEKVEELTLYVIQLNHRLDESSRENDALRARIAALEPDFSDNP